VVHKDVIIILIDDSAGLRKALIKFLQGDSYDGQALEAWDGKIVLEDFCQNKVDLVISTRERPKLDGMELFEVIKRKDGYLKLPPFSCPWQSRNRRRFLKQRQPIASSGYSKRRRFNKQLRYSQRRKR
jgi:CheY-like chemotaxis protein